MDKRIVTSGMVSGHKTSARLKAALDIAAMAGVEKQYSHTHRQIIQMTDEDILTEYALIQKKESRCSARERKLIERQAEKRGLI